MAHQNARKNRKAYMVGALKVEGLRDKPFITRSKIVPGWLNAGDPIINFKTGEEITFPERNRERMGRGKKRYTVGNCVEQKALFQAYTTANRAGLEFPGSFSLTMGVGYKEGKKMVAPCYTCREIMMAMLCTNEAKEGTSDGSA